jgi:hypothetical protein
MNRWAFVAAAGIWAGLAGGAAAEETDDGVFDIAVLTVKNDWQAIRYHRQTGQSWYAVHGDWRPVAEGGESKLPDGKYHVRLTLMGENDWVALRLERKSGRSWRLSALKWVEMKVLDEEKLAPAVGALGP